jgi:secretion/DNA translocation related CpaE-like protein
MTDAPPLLVTADETLLDDILRLAAASGVNLDVARDTESGLRGWSSACLVLVGADQAGRLAARRPQRRPEVHLVGRTPVADELFRDAVTLGARDVVELPAAEGWLVELLADTADGAARMARTVAVVGGSGGAGATTFACALAATAAGAGPALLVDLDPFGPGVDRVVGFDDADGIRWDTLLESRGRFGSRSLRAALPQQGGLAVLTWGPGPAAAPAGEPVREVLSAAQRANDVVVLDLPRVVDEVTAEALGRCDHVLVMTETSVASVASAGRMLPALRAHCDRLALVVRATGSALPGERVADILRLPLVSTVGRQRRLAEHVDLGLGPVHARHGPLARAARAVLRELADRPAVPA